MPRECFVALGRAAYIIQDDAAFHPGWFDSKVNTISRTDWLKLSTTTLSPSEDVLVLPETFLFEINTFAKSTGRHLLSECILYFWYYCDHNL